MLAYRFTSALTTDVEPVHTPVLELPAKNPPEIKEKGVRRVRDGTPRTLHFEENKSNTEDGV